MGSRPSVTDIETAADTLRCSLCRREEPLGDVRVRERDGWPKCCGETMYVAVSQPRRPVFDQRDA